MAYTVEISRHARRDLRKLPRNAAADIEPHIRSLAEDPRPVGSQKLSGEDAFRIRVGDY